MGNILKLEFADTYERHWWFGSSAIPYGKGVISAEQYFGRSNVDKCPVDLSDNTLLACLRDALTQKTIFILQHGDPSQDSCKRRSALTK